MYKGNKNGLVGIFRACKKFQAVQNCRDFKQEYIMLRKRAKSLANHSHHELEEHHDENIEDIMNETHKSDASKKAPTIRAKSDESKRK